MTNRTCEWVMAVKRAQGRAAAQAGERVGEGARLGPAVRSSKIPCAKGRCRGTCCQNDDMSRADRLAGSGNHHTDWRGRERKRERHATGIPRAHRYAHPSRISMYISKCATCHRVHIGPWSYNKRPRFGLAGATGSTLRNLSPPRLRFTHKSMQHFGSGARGACKQRQTMLTSRNFIVCDV